MLKHVQISPLRNRSDSVSLRSSTSCASSMCGSPEPPPELQRTPSRASSYSSLNEQLPQTTIKVFTNCLKIDIEYKTLGIQWDTTSKEVISQLLRRLKMRHRDPRLFYLSMEVSVRRAGVKTILVLDDDTRPAILQACHPKGESRFCLQLRPGGLIRVHTSALQPTSQYKSLVISEETTSDELLQLLLSCYNSMEPVEQFSLYEVCPGQEYQRKLHPDDIPLRAQAERMKRGETCHFLVRRNPNYARRRQLLASLAEDPTASAPQNADGDADSSLTSLDDSGSLLDMSIESLSDDLHSLMATSDDEDCSSSTTSGSSDTSSEGSTTVRRVPQTMPLVAAAAKKDLSTNMTGGGGACPKCRSNFKSCEFCAKNSSMILKSAVAHTPMQQQQQGKQKPFSPSPVQYNPVYNIREIRTVSNSFSSLGNDKKLLDIQLSGRFDPLTAAAAFHHFQRPQSMFVGPATRMILDASAERGHGDVNGNTSSLRSVEAVNNNPSQGLGHYVYL